MRALKNVIIGIFVLFAFVFLATYLSIDQIKKRSVTSIPKEIEGGKVLFDEKTQKETVEEEIEAEIEGEAEEGFIVSENWSVISKETFPDHYLFPNIKVFYPDNWKTVLAGDMSHASGHVIFSSPTRDSSKPLVKILDFVLSGCPNNKNSCSIEKLISLTPQQKYRELIGKIPSDKQVLKLKRLKGLNTLAYHYSIEEKGRHNDIYIINLEDDVISISFINFEKVDSKQFIDDFLDRIIRQ